MRILAPPALPEGVTILVATEFSALSQMKSM
jgi:hypothetical protein